MPIAKITGQGLAGIGLSVALLWGCLITERVIVRQTTAQRVQLIRELRQLRHDHGTVPVSNPVPAIPHPSRVTLG